MIAPNSLSFLAIGRIKGDERFEWKDSTVDKVDTYESDCG
jgi:hypothetical protein